MIRRPRHHLAPLRPAPPRAQAFKRPSPPRSHPVPVPCSRQARGKEEPPWGAAAALFLSVPPAARPHLLQGLGHGGGDDGTLDASLLAFPVALFVFPVLRLSLLRLGHAPRRVSSVRRQPLRAAAEKRRARPGVRSGRKRAGPGPVPPLRQVLLGLCGARSDGSR